MLSLVCQESVLPVLLPSMSIRLEQLVLHVAQIVTIALTTFSVSLAKTAFMSVVVYVLPAVWLTAPPALMLALLQLVL